MKKYQFVAQSITKYIQDNNLKHGDKLPKMTELMAMFKVGKSAVLQALSLLDQQGVIYKIQGSGIFVRNSSNLTGYMSLVQNSGFTQTLPDVTSKLIRFDLLQEPPLWAHKRGLPDSACYEAVRLRSTAGKIFVLETSYFTQSEIPFLSKEIVKGSIFAYIRNGLNKEIRFSDKLMKIRKLNLQEAKLLGLKEGDPTLEVREAFYLSQGQVFDASKLVYNYQNTEFFDQSPDELV